MTGGTVAPRRHALLRQKQASANKLKRFQTTDANNRREPKPTASFARPLTNPPQSVPQPWLGAIVAPTPPPADTLAVQKKELNDALANFSIALNSLPGTGDVRPELHAELQESIKLSRKCVDKVQRGEAKESGAPESNSLELNWVYGYACSGDSRGNVRYTAAGDIVYHAAGVGVTLKAGEEGVPQQKFMLGHGDDLTALAVHPEGAIVATGEIGKKPQIIIWDSTTNKKLQSISGFHTKGIAR
jgi:WD40 repeat protein